MVIGVKWMVLKKSELYDGLNAPPKGLRHGANCAAVDRREDL
jgi:hypothetical protein